MRCSTGCATTARWFRQSGIWSSWHLEFVNVLLQAERRGRIGAADVDSQLALFDRLPITTDFEPSTRASAKILTLARAHRLTSYDAAYLELAVRLGLPLATKDKALIAACVGVNVTVLPGSK